MDRPLAVPVLSAARHSLFWLMLGNFVGLYQSLLLQFPFLQLGEWSYGRWMPVHMNCQLYGWTAMPLIAWLFRLYQVESPKARTWADAALWAWSGSLAVGCISVLGGISSGKLFLDWRAGSLWALLGAGSLLLGVLVLAWSQARHQWSPFRYWASTIGLIVLACVPVALYLAASPKSYPPVDETTGGPTGASLLGSSLVVVGLMLLLPRMAFPRIKQSREFAVWAFFCLSWLIFGVTESMGGTHFDTHQLLAMVLLLPWAWIIPMDWRSFEWPAGGLVWRRAMLFWWGALVVSGIILYQPGILDRLKFTSALVAHSHMAMAGYTTSFCALLLVILTNRPLGNRSVFWWHLLAFCMVLDLAFVGWLESRNPGWMVSQPVWRQFGLSVRTLTGCGLCSISVHWFIKSLK